MVPLQTYLFCVCCLSSLWRPFSTACCFLWWMCMSNILQNHLQMLSEKDAMLCWSEPLFSPQDICYSQTVFCRHVLFQEAAAVFRALLGNILDVTVYLNHKPILDWCVWLFLVAVISFFITFIYQFPIIRLSNAFVLFIRPSNYLFITPFYFHVQVNWIKKVFSWLVFKIAVDFLNVRSTLSVSVKYLWWFCEILVVLWASQFC